MNYEELYSQLVPLEKKMKDTASALQKLAKTVSADTERGDLKDLSKNLAQITQLLAGQEEVTAQIRDLVDGFDGKAYFRDGDFAAQMLALCEENGIDVQGTYPVYEMFPYRVRFDTENQDIYLNRKKFPCLRPASLVQTVSTGRDRLMRASFNDQTFSNDLCEAYDVAVLKEGNRRGTDVYLKDLYKLLVPMSRSRKEYDMQNYAYDLARLYISHADTTKSGRRYQFGPCRYSSKSIRILDGSGKEQFLSTICFYDKE